MNDALPTPLLRLTPDDAAALREAEHFLAREAWLLDHDRGEEWLSLLDPAIRYFAPVRSSVMRSGAEPLDQFGHLAHFDDTIDTLTKRIKRLRTNNAWAEDPRSRVRRFVTNIVLLGAAGDGAELLVGSNLLIHREGADEPSYKLSAYREDRLFRTADGDLSLRERLITIDHVAVPPLSLLM